MDLWITAQNELDDIKRYVAKLEEKARKLKNTRITGITVTAAGAGLLVISNTVTIADQRLKDFLNGLGIGLTVGGGFTLGVSFAF